MMIRGDDEWLDFGKGNPQAGEVGEADMSEAADFDDAVSIADTEARDA